MSGPPPTLWISWKSVQNCDLYRAFLYINIRGIPIRKVPLGRYWVKTRVCFLVKIPVEWDIHQHSRWNLCRDTVWSYMLKNLSLRNKDVKLAKQKKLKKNGICILYVHRVVELEDVTLVNNATLCMNATRCNVVVWRDTMHSELLVA